MKNNDSCQANISLGNIDARRSGEIFVLIFFEDGFPKDHSKAINLYKVVPKNSEMIIPVEVPSHSEFAVVVLHDEDMNGRVTKNWTGYLPKEGLGFSAGVTILRGVPTFQKAKIKHMKNETIKISIRYPGWFGV